MVRLKPNLMESKTVRYKLNSNSLMGRGYYSYFLWSMLPHLVKSVNRRCLAPTTSVRVLWISLFFCFNFEPDCSQHINVLVKFEKLNDKHQATLNYCKIKMNKAQQLSIFFFRIFSGTCR